MDKKCLAGLLLKAMQVKWELRKKGVVGYPFFLVSLSVQNL